MNSSATIDDIRYAYRLLLGREPDPQGLDHYSRFVRDESPTPADLGQYFLTCPEYISRHGVGQKPIEVNFDGYSLFFHPDDIHIGAAVARHVYEPHVAAVVKEVLRPGDTFVDIGANIGFFVALGASIVGKTGKVIAVEPMDKNIQLIARTLWKNGFGNVDVFPFAASSKPCIVPMQTNSRTSNGEVVMGSPDGPDPDLFAVARTLDDMLRDVVRVDLVKFDIEGHELAAWHGFREGMKRHRPLVLTEFHPKCIRANTGAEPADYLDALFGYADRVEVLVSPTVRIACIDTASVMGQWTAADQRHGGGGTTHLDLLVRPRAP